MGTKRTVKAPARSATPIDRPALDAALRLFVGVFVVGDKRTQIHHRLLVADRRRETLTTLPRWLAASAVPLEGADLSPDRLRTRFGELVGVYLDEASAARTTIAHALELGHARPSLFIGDTGNLAMITVGDRPAMLCSRF